MNQNNESNIADEKKVEKVVHAAAAIIARVGDNNRMNVLLIQRSSDDHWPLHWEFPRGKCDKPPGEDLIHCLKREAKEETGLDVTPIEKIDIHEYLAEGGKRKTYCHNYLCMLKNPNQKVKLSNEHDSYKWITELGEVELMVMPEQKKTLEKALNTDRSIVSYPKSNNNEVIEEYLDRLNEVDPVITGAYMAAMVASIAYRTYKQFFTKAARQCKDLPEREKSICMLNAKVIAKNAELNKLKAAASKCHKTKNPEKCKTTINRKVSQASATLKLSRQRMNQLKKGM